jgi:hypothetical protein
MMPPDKAATMAKDAAAHLENAIHGLMEAEGGTANDKMRAAKKAKAAVQALDNYYAVVEASQAQDWLAGLVTALNNVRTVATTAFGRSREAWIQKVHEEADL